MKTTSEKTSFDRTNTYKTNFDVCLEINITTETEEPDVVAHHVALQNFIKMNYPNASVKSIFERSRYAKYERYDITDQHNCYLKVPNSVAVLTIRNCDGIKEWTLSVQNSDEQFSFFNEDEMKAFVKRHNLKVMVPYNG